MKARLVVLVKPSNTASARLFASGGFQPSGGVTERGVRCQRFVLARVDVHA